MAQYLRTELDGNIEYVSRIRAQYSSLSKNTVRLQITFSSISKKLFITPFRLWQKDQHRAVYYYPFLPNPVL